MNEKLKTKNGYYVYLPSNIINEVSEIEATRINKDKMFKFLEFLKTESKYLGKDTKHSGLPEYICNFVPVPKKYLEKVYTNRYRLFIQPLIDHHIIEVNNSYSNFEGSVKCKEYRISPRFLIDFEPNMENIGKVFVEDKFVIEKTDVLEYYLNCAKEKLVDELYLFMEDYLSFLDRISPEDYILTSKEQIGLEYITFIGRDGKYYKQKTEDVLKERGYVIKDKNKFFKCDGALYLKNKIKNMKFHAIECVLKLVNADFYAKRNLTNTRLDTNFTNMPSKIFQKYKEINGLKEFDIKNSQFAILSHVLPKDLDQHKDVTTFKFLSQRGLLYEYVQRSLNLRKREHAKELMISTMFASYKVIDRRIKELFPNVCEYIKQWKKDNGNKEFSIMLQTKEAEIFIDGLLKRFEHKGFCILTKHDSVVVEEELSGEVKQDMLKYFKAINFKCTIGED